MAKSIRKYHFAQLSLKHLLNKYCISESSYQSNLEQILFNAATNQYMTVTCQGKLTLGGRHGLIVKLGKFFIGQLWYLVNLDMSDTFYISLVNGEYLCYRNFISKSSHQRKVKKRYCSP